jgi:hypothetical protein
MALEKPPPFLKAPTLLEKYRNPQVRGLPTKKCTGIARNPAAAGSDECKKREGLRTRTAHQREFPENTLIARALLVAEIARIRVF